MMISTNKYVKSKSRMQSVHLDVADQLEIITALMVVLEQTVKWQRVEQFVEPVVCGVLDVRVLTHELT